MSPKLLKKQAARAERQARKANVKHEAPKSLLGPDGKVFSYAFFYSPKDSVDDVLSITCTDMDGNPFSTLPLDCGRLAWDGIEELDEQYAIHGQQMVDDFFNNINWMRDKCLSLKGTNMVMSKMEQVEMALIAGQICWLTMRGFIKQSEYNGTMVAAISGGYGMNAMPPGFKLPPATQPCSQPYTPNEVTGHYRTQHGKQVFVRSYKRGYKMAA